MLETVGQIVVRRPARAVLELVCDLDRYKTVDTKIVRIVQRADLAHRDTGRVRYSGRLRGLRGPVDTNEVRLQRWTRVDFVGAKDSWPRVLVDFHGWFTCDERENGTLVVHGERFAFHRPGKWLMEPFLARWLAADMEGEMARLGKQLGGSVVSV